MLRSVLGPVLVIPSRTVSLVPAHPLLESRHPLLVLVVSTNTKHTFPLSKEYLLGELVPNDGDGQSDDEDPEGGTDPPYSPAEEGGGGHVSVTNSRHRD